MKKFILAIIPLSLALFSCESSSVSSNTNANFASTMTNSSGGGGGGRSEDQTAAIDTKGSLAQTENVAVQPVAVERKIIRNADLQLEANSPAEAQQKITQIAESKNAFVIETSQASSDVRTTPSDVVNMTIRVPAEKFDEALNEIRATGTRVIEENVKGQDVTEEFIDIEARLKAQRALEAQFLEIMKRATSVEDALNVQTQLADVRGEIERIEGRKRFLENQAALSTIKMRLQTPTSLSANPTGFFYELKEALSTGFNSALKFVLFFITAIIALSPILIFIGLPIYLLKRFYFDKRAAKLNIINPAAKDSENL